MVAPLTPDQARLAAIRAALPALGAGIYLNTAAAGPVPAETARAMAEVAAAELAYGRGHAQDPLDTAERVSEARAAVAAILATDLDAVALTLGTAHGLALAIGAAGLQPGDRAVVGVDDPDGDDRGGSGLRTASSGLTGWPFGTLAGSGLVVAPVPLGPTTGEASLLAAFESALTAGTRLVILPHVLESTGRVLPVTRMAGLAGAAGALVVVDAGQSAGAIPLSPDDLGVDALTVPAERWLLGPAGLGALWCGPRMLERSRILHPGGFADALAALPAGGSPGGAWAGEPGGDRIAWNRAAVVGLARSCGWLSMQVGLDWAWQRSAELTRRAAAALGAIHGVEVLTPADAMGTIVVFRIGGWPAAAALDELGARLFAIAGPVPALDAIRISLAAFNTEAEVGRFIEGVALLAGHTPETLPLRRTLAMLS